MQREPIARLRLNRLVAWSAALFALTSCLSMSRPSSAREQAYLRTQQYDDAALDLAHYQPLILPGFAADPNEPVVKTASLEMAKRFLDAVAVAWVRQNKCGTCHTSLAYLAARPLLGSMDDPAPKEVREAMISYIERISKRVATPGENPLPPEGTPRSPLHMRLPTAAMLAVGDGIAGTVDPRIVAEFDPIWKVQRNDGSFYWPTVSGMLPFLERDADYVTALVALGAGYLPKSYLERQEVAASLAKTVSYLMSQPAKDLHAEMVLTWAGIRTPGLADSNRTVRVIERLRSLQRADGGWSLPSLGSWKRHDGPPNDAVNGPSDGYATGLATFLLCQVGGTETVEPIRRGLAWIRTNQRTSGRWFTRSLYSDQFQHYLSTFGTAYAVMALGSCQVGNGQGQG